MHTIQSATFLLKNRGNGYTAFNKDFGLSQEANTKHDAVMLHLNRIKAELLSLNIEGIYAHVMYRFGE